MKRVEIQAETELAARILVIRGRSVILDSDLATIYGVSTKQLNQQFRRNKGRFPEDFASRLNSQEFRNIRSQNVTALRRNIGAPDARNGTQISAVDK